MAARDGCHRNGEDNRDKLRGERTHRSSFSSARLEGADGQHRRMAAWRAAVVPLDFLRVAPREFPLRPHGSGCSAVSLGASLLVGPFWGGRSVPVDRY
jgi:hypothetical protein